MLAGMWKLRANRKIDNGRYPLCLVIENSKYMTTSYAKTGKCRKQFANKSSRKITKRNFNNIIIKHTIIIYKTSFKIYL